MTVSNQIASTGGTLRGTGTFNADGGLALSGAANKVFGADGANVLNASGTTTLSGGTFRISGSSSVSAGATFNNNGTFIATDDADIAQANDTGSSFNPVFINHTGRELQQKRCRHHHLRQCGVQQPWNRECEQWHPFPDRRGDTTPRLHAHRRHLVCRSGIDPEHHHRQQHHDQQGGDVTLDGAGSTFARIDSINNNQGGFTLKNDRDFTTLGALANSGSVRVEDSTTALTVNGVYTQTGATSSTTLVGGADFITTTFNLNGGSLNGTGDIFGPLTTSGASKISPGLSPGTLTINGGTLLDAGNDLFMELGGLTQGTLYDYLDVNGSLMLGGTLSLKFIDGFEAFLGSGDLFTIMTADSPIGGSFSNVASGGTLFDLDNLYEFTVLYGAGSPYGDDKVVLAAMVPEPGRAMLLTLGGLVVVLRRRRGTRARRDRGGGYSDRTARAKD